MQLSVHKQKSGLEVSEATFGADFNQGLVHQVVTAYLAGARAGTKQNKNRHDVRGGGRKPWRQKGTGRARAGTIRGPIWRGGGVTFAARPRDYSQKVNRKQYRAGLRSILSELARQERLVVIKKDIELKEPKTKLLAAELATLDAPKCLIVAEDISENLYLASRNLPYVQVLDVAGLNPVDLVAAEKVVVTEAAVKKIEEWLA